MTFKERVQATAEAIATIVYEQSLLEQVARLYLECRHSKVDTRSLQGVQVEEGGVRVALI